MQPSSSAQPTSKGALLGRFSHSQALPIGLLVFSLVLFGFSAFVLYLSTILPVDAASAGPVHLQGRRGLEMNFSSPLMLIYFTSGLLAVLGVCMLLMRAWQKRLRKSSFEVYENGIAEVTGNQSEYLAFSDIEDLYLFSSGQVALTGMITNLAYRRNASQPWHHAVYSLKGFHDFIQLVRERYVRGRLPSVLKALQADQAVTFNFISSNQVWRKRVTGGFLKINTQPITLTQHDLQVQGRSVPVSSLRSVDQNTWTEKVVIRDQAGHEVLSTLATGILSHDLFLHTLDALVGVPDTEQRQAQTVLV